MTAVSDEDILRILSSVRRIAVVGASNNPARPSYGVMSYLLSRGYLVVPVNPGLAGQTILGQTVFATLSEVSGPIDMVDIFRASDAAGMVTREAIGLKDKLGIKAIWMQIGVVHAEAAAEARASGLDVVMDRCPHIEIPRLRLAPVM